MIALIVFGMLAGAAIVGTVVVTLRDGYGRVPDRMHLSMLERQAARDARDPRWRESVSRQR